MAVAPPSNMDSLRAQYLAFMQASANPMPLKQVLEIGKLNPVDEGPIDTLFFLFRENLKNTIRQKNVFGLLDAVDENIKNGFGDDNGFAAFVTQWALDKPETAADSKLWQILAEVLDLGGVFRDNQRTFLANYVSATWPPDYDGYEYGSIIGSGVRLRSAPNLQSRTIISVSYDVVKILERTEKEETIGGETFPWVKLALLDGKEGFVYGKFLGSPVGYRAGFERKANGKWQMVFLLAGD